MRNSLIPSAQGTPHYGVLLVVLLILLVVGPAVHAEGIAFGVELMFDFVLVTGAYSAAWQSKHRLPFLALTVATLAVRWTDMALDYKGFSLLSIVMVVAWLVYAVGLIMVALFRMPEVDNNTILGAIVAFLLAAVAFSGVFELIELLQPGAFSGLPASGLQPDIEHALLYFSFVSITTMGYGDILPISALARSFASIEGVFGTLYLAVMIARLVGLRSKGRDA